MSSGTATEESAAQRTQRTQDLATTSAGNTATAKDIWLHGSPSEVDTPVVPVKQVDQTQQQFFSRRQREWSAVPSRRVEGAKLAWGATSGRSSANANVGRGCIEDMAQGFPHSWRKVRHCTKMYFVGHFDILTIVTYCTLSFFSLRIHVEHVSTTQYQVLQYILWMSPVVG